MIIVAGCGYVGASLAGHLHAAGHQVIGLTHSSDSATRLAAEHPWPVAACDITSPDSLAQLAASLDPNQTVTAFVHCASSGRGGADAYRSVYLHGLENLIAAFPSAHPLFTSSTSVYAQKDGSTVTESDPATPPRETGLLLRQAEDLALAKGGTVARLAGIYGPGRSFVLKNLLLGKSGVETEDGIGRLGRAITDRLLAQDCRAQLSSFCWRLLKPQWRWLHQKADLRRTASITAPLVAAAAVICSTNQRSQPVTSRSPRWQRSSAVV